ncbi:MULTISPECIES: hypothetical protein [unclassified Sulfurospirillum]|uniref:hypothetical protein n=1 Tax=unclassified Sulfurospirillum TaxID=2618290 RepID=UPI00068F758F|nr:MULTISPECIES: hypothetical protein [unclassified Sulfurospirillum]
MRLFSIIAPLCAATMMFAAGGSFLSKNAPLYAEVSESSALGELIIASEVKELSQKGSFSEVEFVGFVPEGSNVVYEKAGMLIIGFEASNPSVLNVLGKKTDEYGSVWINVSVKGFVKTDALSSDKSKVLGIGKALFQAKCSTCHALHAEDEFDVNVWPSILEAMGQQAGLSKAERFSIEKYLQNYTK